MRKVLTLVVDYEDGTILPERAAGLLVTAARTLLARGWASDDGQARILRNVVTVSDGDTGVDRIAAERDRQVCQEGWTAEHDDGHSFGELSAAAICYAAHANKTPVMNPVLGIHTVPTLWPWRAEEWKPGRDPLRELAKAGALLAAEIDRLQRQQKRYLPQTAGRS